jgi:hypothetical protein
MQKISYTDLTDGYVFPLLIFTLHPETVNCFLRAFQNNNSFYEKGFVPPLAVFAIAIATFGETFSITPGTVHVSQQLIFSKPVKVGEELTSIATVLRKVSRGKFNMLTIGINILDRNKDLVIKGATGFILPVT